MDIDWNIVVPAVFGSGGVLAATLNYFSTRRAELRIRKVRDNYARIGSIFNVMNTMRASTRATRVCVLKTENGGGIPAPGCDVKSSVVYESVDPTMTRELLSTWQKVQLNGVWANILRKIANERCATLNHDANLGPHFDFLAESDCARVHFILIQLTETAMFYLSVHLATGVELSQQQESTVYQGVRQISQLFQDGIPISEGR